MHCLVFVIATCWGEQHIISSSSRTGEGEEALQQRLSEGIMKALEGLRETGGGESRLNVMWCGSGCMPWARLAQKCCNVILVLPYFVFCRAYFVEGNYNSCALCDWKFDWFVEWSIDRWADRSAC